MEHEQLQLKKSTLSYLEFIAGDESEKIVVTTGLKKFIDQRSQKIDLLKLQESKAGIKVNTTKSELIDIFCNILPSQRRELIRRYPHVIVALPCDFNILEIAELTKLIAYRNPDSRSRSKQIPVFSILDLLSRVTAKQMV